MEKKIQAKDDEICEQWQSIEEFYVCFSLLNYEFA